MKLTIPWIKIRKSNDGDLIIETVKRHSCGHKSRTFASGRDGSTLCESCYNASWDVVKKEHDTLWE